MQLSASELVTIRQQPQSARLNLSIFQPNTVMACQVTGTVARGDRVVSYYNVSTGSYLAVESGMTLLIGTTPGARDVGKIRIKSISASQFTVSENSHIAWAVGQYLTVLRYWEVWPVYPRVINDPSNVDNVIFYKDYDLAYTNQNSILGAFVNAGEHRAIWAGEQSYWSASGTSHCINGTTLSYSWFFEGGGVTGSSSNTPGYITYNNPGHYVTKLIVSGSNGSVDTTYRYISVYNRPENSASNNPVRNWSVDNLSGSRGEGGFHASFRVVDENININDGSVVVLFSDDWYGANNVSLGGNAVNNSKIFFSGYISRSTLRFDRQSSSIEFDVGSISEMMKATETFAISLEDSASPSKWFQLLNLNGKRAIYHYLRWHSTVLYLADFEFVGTDQNIQYFDTDRESVFDAIDNYMRGTLVGKLVSDRQSKLWAEVGTAMYTSPTGSFPPVMSITRADWLGEPTIQQALSDTVSYIEVGGVGYSGASTGTFQAFLSQAPGDTPNGRGRPENLPGLAISGQSQLNSVAGNLYADKNSIYPKIDMDMSAGFRNLDIAPMNTVAMDILSTDTAQGIVIHAPYLVDGMSWKYDVKNQVLLPTISYALLVNGQAGETLTIPEIPDGGGFTDFGGGFNFKPGNFPPFLGSIINSFSSRASGKWGGTIIVDPSLSYQMFRTGTFYNSGFSSIISSQLTIPITGIYLINLNVIIDTVPGVSIIGIQFKVSNTPNVNLRYAVPASSSFTNSFTFMDVQYLVAGQTIAFFTNASAIDGIYGTFTEVVHLLYAI